MPTYVCHHVEIVVNSNLLQLPLPLFLPLEQPPVNCVFLFLRPQLETKRRPRSGQLVEMVPRTNLVVRYAVNPRHRYLLELFVRPDP